MSKSATSFTNKISPESVYHLVHNNNNKNDNTLKKRNALVAFEFKTLLDKVAHPTGFLDLEEEHLSNELSEITDSPRPKEIQTFDFSIRHQTHSPVGSLSSSQPSSPSNNSSASSASSVSQPQIEENLRTFSPPRLPTHRVISPIKEESFQLTKSQSQIISTDFVNNDFIESSKKVRQTNVADNGQNVTIWREQINSKSNVQQQIKKQVRFLI